MNNNDKPTIIKLKETEEKIINLLNSSDIPAFVLKPMVEKIYRQLEILEQQEYEKEKQSYQEQTEKKGDK